MSSPIESLKENMKDVRRLLEFHEMEAGTTRGRKYDVEALNKSGVVLALACWEAYVEDCAVEAFDFVLKHTPSAGALSESVRKHVSKHLRDDKNDLALWGLADGGWRTVLVSYRDSVVNKYVSPLNTPSASNVDALFKDLIGLTDISASWHRHKMSASNARERLKSLIKLRGAIAHRTRATRTVLKKDVQDAVTLVSELASMTANRVRIHVHSLVGAYPWRAEPEPPRAGRRPAPSRTAYK